MNAKRTGRWRNWTRFSLRGLLIVVLLGGGLLGWLTKEMHRAANQREAVNSLQQHATIYYHHHYQDSGELVHDAPLTIFDRWSNSNYSDNPKAWDDVSPRPGPSWVRALLGKDVFCSVKEVKFLVHGGPHGGTWAYCEDENLKQLKPLATLESLSIAGENISDDGLIHLRDLTNLKELSVTHTSITDAGMTHLKGLKNLESLDLRVNKISDVGFLQLDDLSKLESLLLDSTMFGDEGLRHIRNSKQLNTLSLKRTDITNAGLVHLKELENLETLSLGVSSSWNWSFWTAGKLRSEPRDHGCWFGSSCWTTESPLLGPE